MKQLVKISIRNALFNGMFWKDLPQKKVQAIERPEKGHHSVWTWAKKASSSLIVTLGYWTGDLEMLGSRDAGI